MALNINIPNFPYSRQSISIKNVGITLVCKFNTINSSWYLDLYNASGTELVVAGIKVMPNQNLTGRYLLDILPENGNLWCLRKRSTKESVGRSNFGINKDYSLYWLTSEEEVNLGLSDEI